MPPTSLPFDELTSRAQVHRLRSVARAALERYPLDATSIRLVLHSYNTTFRVDTTDGRRYALRINVNHRKTAGEELGEVAWLDALARDTEIVVPRPIATIGGELSTSVWFEPLGCELPVVVMSWLPGRDLGGGAVPAFRELGRLTARLHEHAERWRLPPGASFPRLDRVLIDAPNRMVGDHPAISPDGRSVLLEALERAQRHVDEVSDTSPQHPLHADLHGGNLKWLRGRLAVFDFDDACWGAPVHDLAISAYYVRDEPEREEALLAGYADVRPLPRFTSDQFEAIVAGRNVLLVNDVISFRSADVREAAPTYVRNSVLKLRAYLDTGVYRHDIPGLAPISI